MQRYLKFFIPMVFISGLMGAQPVINLIVFSKNRPLQLYAFLESYEKYVVGTDQISVIYYAGKEYSSAYATVNKRFPAVQFMQQDRETPYADFKKLLCKAADEKNVTHIIFAVDDIIVIDYIDLKQCARALKRHRAYGFYLRLGRDIITCYAEETSPGLPPFKMHKDAIFSWKFCDGQGDWNYPHTVDMTLFAKKTAFNAIHSLDYDSPNTFEHAWAEDIPISKKEYGLCYEASKIVNLPLNLVQEDFLENRHSGECDVQFLLEKFQQGLRMDTAALHQFPHKAPHAEYRPTFIARKDR